MPFQPGHSGNLKGRPKKGQTLTDLLFKKLDKDKFIKRLIELALPDNIKDTDFGVLKLILNYIDGMPVQTNLNADIEDPLSDEEKQKLWKNLKKHFK